MVEILQARNLELHKVKARFNLSQTHDPGMFPEWQDYETACSQLSDHDTYWLDQAKSDFLRLMDYRLHEEVVKISILAPLLSVAGLSRVPFVPQVTALANTECCLLIQRIFWLNLGCDLNPPLFTWQNSS